MEHQDGSTAHHERNGSSRRIDPENTGAVRVASYAHTVGLLGIFLGYFLIAFALTRHTGVSSRAGGQPRPNLLPGYLESMGFDWAILCYVWAGISQRGASLLELAGGRWAAGREVVRDFLIAIPFWIVWEAVVFGVSRLLLTGDHAADDAWVVPRAPIEVLLWGATSMSAGFCEEQVFRGYLQGQFQAFSQSVSFAIVAQGVVFGLIHPRGWRMVATISVLGWLYGALAAWRRNLKPNMLARAISDLWEGWLKHNIWMSF